MNPAQFETPRCPGSLKGGNQTYSNFTLRHLFLGKKIFHVLPDSFSSTELFKWQSSDSKFHELIDIRAGLNKKNELIVKDDGEYLLKTVLETGSQWRFINEQPGNEHLCQQLAYQIYNLNTIPNALIFFADGKPSIIYRDDKSVNDFQSFEELLDQENNAVRKGHANYLQIFNLIDQHCAASTLVKDRFFINLLFMWLVSFTTSTLKNSGLVKSLRGDLILAPMRGTMCSSVHYLNPEIELEGGLFHGDKDTPEFREYGHYTRNEFESLGRRAGISQNRLNTIFNFFNSKKNASLNFVELAFLPDDVKKIIKLKLTEKFSRIK